MTQVGSTINFFFVHSNRTILMAHTTIKGDVSHAAGKRKTFLCLESHSSFFFFKNLTDSSFDLDKRCRTPFVSIKKSDVACKEEKATLARKQTDRFIW